MHLPQVRAHKIKHLFPLCLYLPYERQLPSTNSKHLNFYIVPLAVFLYCNTICILIFCLVFVLSILTVRSLSFAIYVLHSFYLILLYNSNYFYKPSNRVPAVSFLNHDLVRIGDWWKRWCMLVSPTKTKALVISWLRSLSPVFPNL